MPNPIALSVRQPWAWLIIHAGKDIENRTWRSLFRGRVLIHAGVKCDRLDYEHAARFLAALPFKVELPPYASLLRGGVIGSVEIIGCYTTHPSPWFEGPYGYHLARPQAVPFVKCPGALGFFPITVNLNPTPEPTLL